MRGNVDGSDPLAQIPAGTNAYTDTAVALKVGYEYRIRAENDYASSDYTAIFAIRPTAPGPPANVLVSAISTTTLHLSWASDGTAATVRIERQSAAGDWTLVIGSRPRGRFDDQG